MTRKLLSPAVLALFLAAAFIRGSASADAQTTLPPEAAAAPTATVILDDNSAKQTITVAPNSAVTVQLKTAPLSGYHWEVTWIDGPCKQGENLCWDRYYHPIKPEFSAQLGYAVATIVVPSQMRVVFGYFPPIPAGGTGTTGATASKVFEVTVEVTAAAPTK